MSFDTSCSCFRIALDMQATLCMYNTDIFMDNCWSLEEFVFHVRFLVLTLVTAAPVIVQPTNNVTVVVNATQTASFLCEATGYPQPSLRWMSPGDMEIVHQAGSTILTSTAVFGEFFSGSINYILDCSGNVSWIRIGFLCISWLIAAFSHPCVGLEKSLLCFW